MYATSIFIEIYLLIRLYIFKFTPPDYQLSRITAPVALFASDNDLIANPIDVNRLRRELNSKVYDYRDTEYNHFDFIWAKDVEKRIYYPHLLELLSQY